MGTAICKYENSGVDTFVISRLRTKAPDIKTTSLEDRSFPFHDQEVLSVYCVQFDVMSLYLSQHDKFS